MDETRHAPPVKDRIISARVPDPMFAEAEAGRLARGWTRTTWLVRAMSRQIEEDRQVFGDISPGEFARRRGAAVSRLRGG